MKKSFVILSYILHPIFVPIFGVLFYFYLSNSSLNPNQKLLFFLQVFSITFCIPVTIYFLLKAIGKVDSVMISEPSQRKLPLLFQIFLLSILVFNTIQTSNFPELNSFFIGGMISATAAFLLLFLNFKASLHLIGISSLTVFIISISIKEQTNYLGLISFFLILNGLLATSRLVMKAHTNFELIIGFSIGFISQLITWMLL